ncbi:MAG: hypothetical protein KKB70_08990 [Proteobacteria bacterium]|nr:hypothetical protein [Pseudomonadota bacterium]MBU1610707.1 hypothetical protein [Pseudomonadota bacterium]
MPEPEDDMLLVRLSLIPELTEEWLLRALDRFGPPLEMSFSAMLQETILVERSERMLIPGADSGFLMKITGKQTKRHLALIYMLFPDQHPALLLTSPSNIWDDLSQFRDWALQAMATAVYGGKSFYAKKAPTDLPN